MVDTMPDDAGQQHSNEQILQFVQHLKDVMTKLSHPPPDELIQIRDLFYGSHSRERLDPITFQRVGSILYQKRNPTMGEVSQALTVPLSTATRMANWWVDNGYAQRLPDPDDRRIVRLTLTDSGQQFLEALESHMRQTVQKVLSCLTGEERTILVTLASKVAASLEAPER